MTGPPDRFRPHNHAAPLHEVFGVNPDQGHEGLYRFCCPIINTARVVTQAKCADHPYFSDYLYNISNMSYFLAYTNTSGPESGHSFSRHLRGPESRPQHPRCRADRQVPDSTAMRCARTNRAGPPLIRHGFRRGCGEPASPRRPRPGPAETKIRTLEVQAGHDGEGWCRSAGMPAPPQ